MFQPATFIECAAVERHRRSRLISALSNLRMRRPEVIRPPTPAQQVEQWVEGGGTGGALVHDIHLLMPFFFSSRFHQLAREMMNLPGPQTSDGQTRSLNASLVEAASASSRCRSVEALGIARRGSFRRSCIFIPLRRF